MLIITITIIIQQHHYHCYHHQTLFRHLYAVNAESGVVTGLDGAIQRLVVNGDAWTNIASRLIVVIVVIIVVLIVVVIVVVTIMMILRRADDAMAMGTYQGPPCQNNPCRYHLW